MYTVIQLDVVSPPQNLRAVNLLVSHSQHVYKSLETLFVCFDGISVNETFNSSNFVVDKSEILRESQRERSVI